MEAIRTYLKSRARLLLCCALGATIWTCSGDRIDERSEPGLMRALSQASSREVERFVWEPRRSALSEYIWGRPLLFTARKPAERRDVFRAFVRLAPSGAPLGIRAVRNLTATSLADETGLAANAELALYATEQGGRITSLTALGLSGPVPLETSFFTHAQLWLSLFLRDGDTRGLARTDLLLSEPSFSAQVSEQGALLEFDLDGRTFALSRSTLLGSARKLDASTRAHVTLSERVVVPSTFAQWSADSLRSLLGPGPVAWLEGRSFSALDRIHRWTRPGTGAFSTAPNAPRLGPAARPSVAAEATPTTWPPQPLPALLSPARPEEGRWHAWSVEFLPADAQREPYFYRTFLHPDAARPYAEVRLVAIDSRRLELGMRAGYEDPHPETGPPGSGHIPDDPRDFSRIVATFNGAFKAVHGAYGMQAEGRLLVPPTAGAATVRVDGNGNVGFGDWPNDPSSGRAVAPGSLAGMVEFRQNLDALVAAGKPNPKGRSVWGDHLYGSLVPAERSALCTTGDGVLLYAWSPEISAEALAESLIHAGCVYAIHLDMNPGHCTFALHQVRSFQPLDASGVVLDSRMKVNANRYLRWSPQDFFYLATRSAAPQRSTLRWSNEQSAPFAQGQGSAGGLPLELERLPLDAWRFGIEVGRGDAETSPVEQALALRGVQLAWGLGHRTPGTRSGLLLGTNSLIPLVRTDASLVLSDSRGLELVPPGVPILPAEGVLVVQLPVLARDGELTALARELGDRRSRAALCVDATGHLLIGRVVHDTIAPLVATLLNEGCQLVVALDRGSHHLAQVTLPRAFDAPTPDGAGGASNIEPSLESRLLARPRPPHQRGYVF